MIGRCEPEGALWPRQTREMITLREGQTGPIIRTRPLARIVRELDHVLAPKYLVRDKGPERKPLVTRFGLIHNERKLLLQSALCAHSGARMTDILAAPRAVLSWLPVPQQDAIKAAFRKLRYRGIRAVLSYSPTELELALRKMGVSDGDAIVMQSAYSNLNGFDGDPQHVIDCVLDVIGPTGHLFMVSMPYDGLARQYLTDGGTFDVRRTPSQMGLLTESFRRRRGVLRSANPLHPVLAWGPRAEWLVADHDALPHSCGKGSPFEKMLTLGTKALLFDVGLEVLTFTHYLEDSFQESAPVPVYAAKPIDTTIVDSSGLRRGIAVYPFSEQAVGQRNFAVLYDAMLRQELVQQVRIGNTRLQLFSLQSVLDTGTSLVRAGTHIYGAAGESVRVTPTRRDPLTACVAAIGDEIASGRAARAAKRLVNHVRARLLGAYRAHRLPAAARREVQNDHRGVLGPDPGIEQCVRAAIDWLCDAQDRSASQDGGVARDFSLIAGWSPSYAETTGYVIPTMLDYARRTGDAGLMARGRRMLDWLVSIQLPEGGFQGGVVGANSAGPVTFNTGQILLGLAAGAATFGDERYLQAMHRAARWLVDTQDADGCWRAFPSPFAAGGEKTYETHVAWGLFEAARVAPGAGYEQAAIRNVRWALSHQRSNGWFGRCCLSQPAQPLTHAIGYALRGVLEAYRFTGDESFLQPATKAADALIRAMGPNGVLPGRLRSDWSPAVSWTCLTGLSQIACCWLQLYEQTGSAKYLSAATRANQLVRRTIHVDGVAGRRGGVKGSFPVDGEYCAFELPNWAAKFTIDANLAERECASRARARESLADVDEAAARTGALRSA